MADRMLTMKDGLIQLECRNYEIGVRIRTMTTNELKLFLDEKAQLYEKLDFIVDDPIQIPHLFTKKEDIEIAGFLTSIIAWGQRKTIITNASKLMKWMDDSPHDFLLNHRDSDLKVLLDLCIELLMQMISYTLSIA